MESITPAITQGMTHIVVLNSDAYSKLEPPIIKQTIPQTANPYFILFSPFNMRTISYLFIVSHIHINVNIKVASIEKTQLLTIDATSTTPYSSSSSSYARATTIVILPSTILIDWSLP